MKLDDLHDLPEWNDDGFTSLREEGEEWKQKEKMKGPVNYITNGERCTHWQMAC